jgi:arylsulfatase A-like enzyme
VIVILVENLGFGTFSCSDGLDQDNEAGFRTFCDESVRFTHAYSPSNLSQATVASVLTGQYPFENGVRHNGSQALSSKIETAAEIAVKNHYRTSFFSGGAPIWRKSGLSQGFELFDDNIQPTLTRAYRPAHDVVQLFLKWQAQEAPHGQLFSFLYFGDLQFADSPTTNEIGELRESSFESQVDEVRESLARLVRELKRRQLWDGSTIVLAGLNGVPSEARVGEPRALNLSSEATRVVLMVKPARRGRDGPFNWKIDSNVTLVDVGATIFDLLGKPLLVSPEKVNMGAQVVSLKSVLHGPEPDWPDDRKVLVESDWGEWRGIGSNRFAVRKGPDLLVQNKPDLLFDTLTDNLEMTPLPRDGRSVEIRSELTDFLYGIKPEPWAMPARSVSDKFELARELWRNQAPTSDTLARLKSLSMKYRDDIELVGWRAIWALRMANWKELKALAGKDEQEPVWAFVALRNLSEKATLPDQPCLAFLKSAKAAAWKLDKSCNNDALANLIDWANDTNEPAVRTRGMESFIRNYAVRALYDRISEQNYVTGLMWDTNIARLREPDIVDLILALPEMRKFRSTVLRRLAGGASLGSG